MYTGNHIADAIDDSENFTDEVTEKCFCCHADVFFRDLIPVKTNYGSLKHYVCTHCQQAEIEIENDK